MDKTKEKYCQYCQKMQLHPDQETLVCILCMGKYYVDVSTAQRLKSENKLH